MTSNLLIAVRLSGDDRVTTDESQVGSKKDDSVG